MDTVILKRLVESFFDCTCSIYEYTETTNAETGVTSFSQVLSYSNVRCRISYATGLFQGASASKGFDNNSSKHIVKLFLPSEISVKPGSVFEVTKNGSIIKLKNSGRIYMYSTHQEILIESSEEYN